MKLLFITHDTTRTGAPMVVLHFLRWLQQYKPHLIIDVLALKGGDMEDDFKANSNTYYNYALATKKAPLSLMQRVFKKFKLYTPKDKGALFLANIAGKGYDVIYANTVVAIPMGIQLKALSVKSKLLAHVHELDTVIHQVFPDFNKEISAIDYYIAASQIVADNLIDNRGVNKVKVSTIYECATVQLDSAVKKEINSPFVIGASGHVSMRKGYDVFLQVARYVATHYKEANVLFTWVGGIHKNIKVSVDSDIKKLGLEGKVQFVGEQSNPSVYFSSFDVFLMTSREDPFPLVCIEVGLLGKPIISFDKAVGTNEVLKDGGGFVVPYLDVEIMAKRVMEYYNNEALLHTDGAYNKSAFAKFTPELICPQYFEKIETVLLP